MVYLPLPTGVGTGSVNGATKLESLLYFGFSLMDSSESPGDNNIQNIKVSRL